MPEIIVPAPWRTYTNGRKAVRVQGTTVAEALSDLVERYPALADHLFSAEGGRRLALHLFLGEQEVQSLQGEETALAAGDRLILVLPIGGGRGEMSARI